MWIPFKDFCFKCYFCTMEVKKVESVQNLSGRSSSRQNNCFLWKILGKRKIAKNIGCDDVNTLFVDECWSYD